MKWFLTMWSGQLVSLIGTSMTQFAITFWVYQTTGKATLLSLISFLSFFPVILVSPIAGAIVDRYNRKAILIMVDSLAALSTLSLLILVKTGYFQVWHLFIISVVTGICQAFQYPAYTAAVTTMVPQKHYARAGGLTSLSESASRIIAPLLAAFLLSAIGFAGILTIDLISFSAAFVTIVFAIIPQPEKNGDTKEKSSIWKESIFGFKYIFQHKGLLNMQILFMIINFFTTIAFTLIPVLLLARTGNNQVVYGTVTSVAGVGGVVGGIFLSIWGGGKKKIHGVLAGIIASQFLGMFVFGLSAGLLMWCITAFVFFFFIPITNGNYQAIWQTIVNPELQGRVFAVRRMMTQAIVPVAMIIAGPIVDWFFEPAMLENGSLSNVFGWLVGTEPGSGTSLLFVFLGIIGGLIGIAGYLNKSIREIEGD